MLVKSFFLVILSLNFASILFANASESDDIRSRLKPYLLDETSPLKKKLDKLFGKTRVTESVESFEKAGFGKVRLRKPTNIVVGKHKDFKGYLFKVYLDSQPPVCEWCNWIMRIEGAKCIKECIKRRGYRNFTVPDKWIYLLPSRPLSKGAHPKCSVLIVKEIDILDASANLKAYKTKMNARLLRELFTIIDEERLLDSVFPDNAPFTRAGKIAFIDTEHFHCSEPIPFHKLSPYLSPDMQKRWNELVQLKLYP